MSKFHITDEGKPSICKAYLTDNPCALGENILHYDTLELAVDASQQILEYDSLKSIKKSVPVITLAIPVIHTRRLNVSGKQKALYAFHDPEDIRVPKTVSRLQEMESHISHYVNGMSRASLLTSQYEEEYYVRGLQENLIPSQEVSPLAYYSHCDLKSALRLRRFAAELKKQSVPFEMDNMDQLYSLEKLLKKVRRKSPEERNKEALLRFQQSAFLSQIVSVDDSFIHAAIVAADAAHDEVKGLQV